MANRVKTISKYSGSAWGTEVPIGADATNVDMTTAPSDYDSSTSETSKVLIGTNDVKAIASDTDLTAWGKFNRFRRRVSNKFADYFATANLTGSSTGVTSTGDDNHAYTTAALNAYFGTVVGYSSAADVSGVGSVASQLSSLNSNLFHIGMIIQTTNANFDPNSSIGVTWARIKDRFLLAAGDTYSAGSTGGSADAIIPSHTHTIDGGSCTIGSSGSHSHSGYYRSNLYAGGSTSAVCHYAAGGTSYASAMFGGGDHSHTVPAHSHNCSNPGESVTGKNMPPYLVVYVWQKTA